MAVAKGDANRRSRTEFQLHGDRVPVELFEEIQRISTQPDVCRNWRYRNCKYEPTGQLVLKVDAYADAKRSRWADGKHRPLEAMLGAFSDALIIILDRAKIRRLDEECIARQRAAVRKVREDAAKRQELAEQRRSQLFEEVNAWKQAGDIRSYLAAIRAKLDAGELAVRDQVTFSSWIDWATWYADSIDPLTVTPRREEFATSPSKAAVSELDLTRTTRAVVEQLRVQDTDDLFAVERDALQELCGRWRTTEWDEIGRVLEARGYPVASRYRDYCL